MKALLHNKIVRKGAKKINFSKCVVFFNAEIRNGPTRGYAKVKISQQFKLLEEKNFEK